MDMYLYATDEKPETPVSPRYPWYTDNNYIEGVGITVDNVTIYTDEDLEKMRDVPDRDELITNNWDRRHSLHGYFHRLFLEKGGVYDDEDLPFSVPDAVYLTLDDLVIFENVLRENRLPHTPKYHKAPKIKTEEQLLREWVKASHKKRRKLAKRIVNNARFLEEDLDIIKTATEKLVEGKYIYVCSCW